MTGVQTCALPISALQARPLVDQLFDPVPHLAEVGAALGQRGLEGRVGRGRRIRSPTAGEQPAARDTEGETEQQADEEGEQCIHADSVTSASDTGGTGGGAPARADVGGSI